MSDNYRAILDETIRSFVAAQNAAIEEAAERILLSGTNWGIDVYSWIEHDRYVTVVVPTADHPGHPVSAGPAAHDCRRVIPMLSHDLVQLLGWT